MKVGELGSSKTRLRKLRSGGKTVSRDSVEKRLQSIGSSIEEAECESKEGESEPLVKPVVDASNELDGPSNNAPKDPVDNSTGEVKKTVQVSMQDDKLQSVVITQDIDKTNEEKPANVGDVANVNHETESETNLTKLSGRPGSLKSQTYKMKPQRHVSYDL